MNAPLPDWVHEALETPLMFAQVREDAWQDLELAKSLVASSLVASSPVESPLADGAPRGVQVLQVGSGGCTAAALAAEAGVSRLVVVDPNPAQLALCRLKLQLLQELAPQDRRPLLGHGPLDPAERAATLTARLARLGLSADALGPASLVARLGPDQSGRYEQTFAALRVALEPERHALEALLRLGDPDEQSRRVAAGTILGDALEAAFQEVFALPTLVELFGEGATSNPARPFAEHFLERTRAACGSLPACTNPYLWQVFAGRFPPDVASPWLELPQQTQLAGVEFVQRFMNDALREVEGEFDLVHVSNILDWLSPKDARETLQLAAARLRLGGLVVVRQLNSTVDVRGAAPSLRWERDLSDRLHAQDRSFFYRDLHLGRRLR